MAAQAAVVLSVPVTLFSRSGEMDHCHSLPAHVVDVEIKVREGTYEGRDQGRDVPLDSSKCDVSICLDPYSSRAF